MVPASASHLKKLRTFAQDIDEVRSERLSATPIATISTSTTPAPAPVIPTPAATPLPRKIGSVTPTIPTVIPVKNTAPLPIPLPPKIVVPPPPAAPINPPIKLTASASRDASYPATIITDTKTNRFNLLGAISKSVTGWFRRKTTSSVPAAYTVPPTELRKGIVAVATTTTARTTTDDHKQIVARLKAEYEERKRLSGTPIATAAVPTPTIITPSWDTGSTDTTPKQIIVRPTVTTSTPADIITPTEPTLVVTPIESTITVPTIPVPATKAPLAPVKTIFPVIPELPPEPQAPIETVTYNETSVTLQEPIATFKVPLTIVHDEPRMYIEPEPEVAPMKIMTEAPIPRPIQEPESLPPVITPRSVVGVIKPQVPTQTELPTVNIPVASSFVAPMVPVSTTPAPRPVEENIPTVPATMQGVRSQIEARKQQLQQARQATPISRGGVWDKIAPLAVVFGSILVVVGTVTYFIIATPKSVATPTTTTTTTSEPNTVNGAGVPSNTSVLTIENKSKVALFTALQNISTEDQSLELVAINIKTGEPLYRDDILGLLSRNLGQDFRNNVTTISVGSYRDNPVIIITVADAATAKGSLFNWEKTMSRDLSPWFGSAITTKSTTSITGFSDTTSGTTDVRVLKNDKGEEKITYGFVHENTIIVTNTNASFLNIATTYLP